MIGLRTLGLVGGQGGAGLGTPMDQLKQAFSQVTSFMMPPAVEAVLSYNGMTSRYGGISALPDDTGGQGANAEMMTPGSEIPATVYNVVSSLLGSGANLAMQTFNAFDIAADKEHSYTKAFGDAMAVAGSEFKSKLPQISVPGVWDAQRRYGASTPEATYVYNALNDLNPIIGSSRQISVEHDADHNIQQMADEGFAAPQKISDPLLKNISEAVYTRLKQKGKFKELSDTYTDLRRQVQALDRMRNTSNQSKWLTQRNLVIQQQQSIRSSQAKELQKMEHVLMSQVGPAFEQRFGVPFSYKNLSKLVQKDVGTAR